MLVENKLKLDMRKSYIDSKRFINYNNIDGLEP